MPTIAHQPVMPKHTDRRNARNPKFNTVLRLTTPHLHAEFTQHPRAESKTRRARTHCAEIDSSALAYGVYSAPARGAQNSTRAQLITVLRLTTPHLRAEFTQDPRAEFKTRRARKHCAEIDNSALAYGVYSAPARSSKNSTRAHRIMRRSDNPRKPC